MTNYRLPLTAAALLLAGACDAANAPAPKPVVVNPAATPAPAAATSTPAPSASTAASRWVQAPGSSLTFTFDQAGAASKGSFRQFATELVYDEKTPTAGRLDVKVQMFDVQGRLVRTLADNPSAPAGYHDITIVGMNSSGVRLASGRYFVMVSSADGREKLSVTILK